MIISLVSAESALQQQHLNFADEILASMEKREVCGAMFLDLSKAFDTVDHAISINLKKLSANGVSTDDLAWFASYLTLRNNWPIRSSCGRDDVKLTRVGAI